MKRRLLILLCPLLLLATAIPGFADVQTENEIYKIPLSAGYQSYLVIDHEGTLWGWGDNFHGCMPQFSPEIEADVQVPLMENVVAAYAGVRRIFAIDEDGGLWGIGPNGYGLIPGKPDELPEWEPYKIMDDVVQIYLDTFCCFAVQRDGSLWFWGVQSGDLWGDIQMAVVEPICLADDVRFVSGRFFIKKDLSLWQMVSIVQTAEGEIHLDAAKISDNVLYVVSAYQELLMLKTDASLWRVEKVDATYDFNSAQRLLENVTFCDTGLAVQTDGSLWSWEENQLPQKIACGVECAVKGTDSIIFTTVTGEVYQETNQGKPARTILELRASDYDLPNYEPERESVPIAVLLFAVIGTTGILFFAIYFCRVRNSTPKRS